MSKLIYKRLGRVALAIKVYAPAEGARRPPLPAIVFFFGGGWITGNLNQFKEHCKYFAAHGLFAGCAEYRVRDRHGTTPFDAVADAKSVIRFLRAKANELCLDPGKIIAAGGSAGGHLAACAAFIEGFEEPFEDLTISSKPDALVLFNPVLDTTETGFGKRQIGEHCRDLSPVHHIVKNGPPTIIFHGTADRIVPLENIERFKRKMVEAGNPCKLFKFKDKDHGFFNFGRDNNRPFKKTVREAEQFLVSSGLLPVRL